MMNYLKVLNGLINLRMSLLAAVTFGYNDRQILEGRQPEGG